MSCDPVLTLFNTQMENQGILQTNCDLLFFTHVLCYKIKMCCFSGLNLFVYDRLKPDFGWTFVAYGTMMQLVDTLNQNGPFLSGSDISTFWTVLPT